MRICWPDATSKLLPRISMSSRCCLKEWWKNPPPNSPFRERRLASRIAWSTISSIIRWATSGGFLLTTIRYLSSSPSHALYSCLYSPSSTLNWLRTSTSSWTNLTKGGSRNRKFTNGSRWTWCVAVRNSWFPRLHSCMGRPCMISTRTENHFNVRSSIWTPSKICLRLSRTPIWSYGLRFNNSTTAISRGPSAALYSMCSCMPRLITSLGRTSTVHLKGWGLSSFPLLRQVRSTC